MRTKRKNTGFPRTIARFLGLQGGPYGDLELVATARDRIEVRSGDDYVVFTRKHAEEMRDAMVRFLELEKLSDEEIIALETVEVTPARVSVAEAIVSERHAEGAHRRRTRATG